MKRGPPGATLAASSAASEVYTRQLMPLNETNATTDVSMVEDWMKSLLPNYGWRQCNGGGLDANTAPELWRLRAGVVETAGRRGVLYLIQT